ncbi:hypothetical protein NS183_07695 [Microbacterium testaceum]|uniref:LamG-like jellyroll fold domain-containing protein n=1 Tax=Microbacterium testaceum TaxID=2033 RepID=UPI0007346DF9|nr:LamG-like jellyroll fold domain-containing protein [Microbacterium testaceum]KTS90661.1 hypothetical protein NS183_07695 [Microbacterium testaceum]
MSTPISTMSEFDGDDSGFTTDNPIYAIPDITTGLLLDYNADSLGSVGSSVTSWASSAGSLGAAANLTSGSSPRPTVVDGPNGHKAVRFVASSSQYLMTALFGTPLSLPMTQVVILRPAATSTASIVSGHYDTAANYIGIRRVSSGYDAGAGASSEIVNGSSSDTSAFHVVTARHGASGMLRVDTVKSNGATGQASASRANLPRVTIGADAAHTASFLSGDVARVLMFSRALTDADIASLHATLGATYGIAA